MKKIHVLILLCVAITSTTFAQGLYFRAGGGYATPVATQVIGYEILTTQDYTGNNNINVTTVKSVSASYGAGANFNLGGGYMITEHIGFELNVQYTMGRKFETSNSLDYMDDGVSGRDETILKTFSRSIYFNPSFVITTGSGSKMPYGRFGAILCNPKIKGEQTYYNDLDGTSTGSLKWEMNKGMAYGIQGAVGMNWMLSGNIDLFTEINFISMTYYAKERTVTEDIFDDVDQLPDYSTYYKETIYKREITLNAPVDINKPREELREGRAFSTVSLQVGIIYRMGGRVE
ncbi:MAG TPA: outer membrane beta-barrel protein [Chryseolinea sp.]|nr:outer membrane beta-barrel protein [Chryseolinea sp.]HPM30160.1 outer membrane beta-barrel protein [Chryseolinea sp.]